MIERTVSFSTALMLLKEGDQLARKGWAGKGLFVKLRTADACSPLTGEYFTITDRRKGTCQTWVPSVGDLLASDWATSDA